MLTTRWRAAGQCQEPAVNLTADCWPHTSPDTHGGSRDSAGSRHLPLPAVRQAGHRLHPRREVWGNRWCTLGLIPWCKRCLGDSSPHHSRLLLPTPTMQQRGRTPKQGKSVQFFRQGEKSAPMGTGTGSHGRQLNAEPKAQCLL